MQHGKIADPVQDPKLFRLVKVRALRPFCVAGKRVEVGAEAEVPYHVALDLVAIKKCEILEVERRAVAAAGVAAGEQSGMEPA